MIAVDTSDRFNYKVINRGEADACYRELNSHWTYYADAKLFHWRFYWLCAGGRAGCSTWKTRAFICYYCGGAYASTSGNVYYKDVTVPFGNWLKMYLFA